MVWFDLEWIDGVEWYQMVWYGVKWYGKHSVLTT